MKLWNKTRIPDNVVHALVAKAGRAVGARTAKVVVVVKSTNRDHGQAYSCSHVRACSPIFGRGRSKSRRWIRTDGGYIELFVQRYPGFNIGSGDARNTEDNAARLAQKMFELAMHEWGHIADFQANDAGAGLEFSKRGRRSGRRPAWGDRPEEIRAEGHVEAAKHAGADTKARSEIYAYAAALLEDWLVAPATATAVHVAQSSGLVNLDGKCMFGRWYASLTVEGAHVGHARIHADGDDEHAAYLAAVTRARAMGVKCEGVEMHVGPRVSDEDRTRFREFIQARSEVESARTENER